MSGSLSLKRSTFQLLLDKEDKPIEQDAEDNTFLVIYNEKKSKRFPLHSQLGDILETPTEPETGMPYVGALVNNELRGLNERIDITVHSLTPVSLVNSLGSQIYRRSLCFVLSMAFSRLFPKQRLVIGHSLGNGFYYESPELDSEITERMLTQVSEEMERIVKSEFPILRRYISWEEAVLHLRNTNQEQTLELVSQHNTARINMVICDGYLDLWHGPHLSNTKYLRTFELKSYSNGFLLRFPPTQTPNLIPEFIDRPNIFEAFQWSKERGRRLGVQCVGDLNQLVRTQMNGGLSKYILVSESIHQRRINTIAQTAISSPKTKVILIAGPSSSGKTTFARKLCIELQAVGKKPEVISLDDFYLHPDLCPKDETGECDFECLEALDVPYINKLLASLIKGEEVTLPKYDFKTVTRTDGRKLKLVDESVIVIEGIHGLNDKLTAMIPAENKYKIFISALTQLNLDEHNRIATTDNRCLRRIVRDFQFRGVSAEDTLLRWSSVRAGEEKHIFPFQGNADIVFNSALDYELAALKVIAGPLLRNITPHSSVYNLASRLLRFLDNFDQIIHKHVPQASILREFIGDSPYHEEHWEN
ncbi:putative nucleoside kinase [Blattamonas nauphoetae]|uniref:Nucleoside kinase n=1 Tax=Blattamonas nauphoetae TaxID=2049346 RepID=A0ABQ9XTA0_9EUKA|nr:putative nucleoside kinase [Blattamonas nauphoetae]